MKDTSSLSSGLIDDTAIPQESHMQSFLPSDQIDFDQTSSVSSLIDILGFDSIDFPITTAKLAHGKLISNRPPFASEILKFIPDKEGIHNVRSTLGIYIADNYIHNEVTSRNSLSNSHYMDRNIEDYFDEFVNRPEIVLSAIRKCAPLVIAAHRNQIDTIVDDFFTHDSFSGLNNTSLWRLAYIDLRNLVLRLRVLLSHASDEKEQLLLKRKYTVAEAINNFRSPHYSLLPYFNIELQFLKDTKLEYYKLAVSILKETANERYYVTALGNPGTKTKKPTNYIILMPYLVRHIFNNLLPGNNIHIYNRFSLPSKGSRADCSPIVSLHTENANPLTRAHKVIHDAVCTLWAAGNEVITDSMIARTIWPRAARRGSESFSQRELDAINRLMDDMRQAYLSIDATNELRKYKKIGQDDCWVTKSHVIPSSIVYQKINGGQYLHRAYKILEPPICLSYSSLLGQVFDIPISLMEAHKENTQERRTSRTLRSAQVRSLILERIYHFRSPSYKRNENVILFDRIYEAYEIPSHMDSNRQKKERAAARKIAIGIMNALKHSGIVQDYKIEKKNGSYSNIQVLI